MFFPAGTQVDADADSTGTLAANLEPWLQTTLASLNNGIRRSDNEAVIGFVNYIAAGVVSSWKQHFALQQITSMCHSNPRSFLGVLVLPNRAGDLRSASKRLAYQWLRFFILIWANRPYLFVI